MIRNIAALLCLWSMAAAAELPASQRSRIVIAKLDGVPEGLLEQTLHETDPKTGKSRLPWIDEVFVRNGTRLANFYVRGISLSAPSWAMLDTGRHQRIHGNVEYDRLTMRTYDYLNFLPFYIGVGESKLADMPGVEVLDASGVPLLSDRFAWPQRFQSFQLYERWVRWRTLQHGFQNHFLHRPPRQVFDEWQTGLDLAGSIGAQTERDLIGHLAGSDFLYLDFFTGDFDHIAHLTNDRAAQVDELQRIDSTIGRIWVAIRNSPLADRTVLAVVSDHGMNSVPGTYSQGYSLVDWFGSAEGGGHHTVTDRFPLSEFKVKAIDPFLSHVINPGRGATYLKGESADYPTAFLDVDGNERAAVQFRNSDLNMLHILLKEIARKDLPPRLRAAAAETFFEIIDSHRAAWERMRAEMTEELGALRRSISRVRAEAAADPKKHWTYDEKMEGLQQPNRRRRSHLASWEQDEKSYTDYLRTVSNLLALKRGADLQHQRIDDLIPKRSLGDANTLYDLQNYVAGPSREGFATRSSDAARLDVTESFRRLNYFAALKTIAVRNNVQKDVGPNPVDFLAARVPGGIFLYAAPDSEVIVESRENASGQLELRYVPVSRVQANSDHEISRTEQGWKPGLPLQLWEDPNLQLPTGADRDSWLREWHTDREWLAATCRTRYSNGIVGINEQFVRPEPLSAFDPSASPADQVLLRRFEARRRKLVEPDLLIFACDHWNFNVRSFNPGGNHGSFLQISTHSVMMLAGTGIPQGRVIETPYDSLSFAPTVLQLGGFDISGLPGPVVDFAKP